MYLKANPIWLLTTLSVYNKHLYLTSTNFSISESVEFMQSRGSQGTKSTVQAGKRSIITFSLLIMKKKTFSGTEIMSLPRDNLLDMLPPHFIAN